jgi:hypothetical protein
MATTGLAALSLQKGFLGLALTTSAGVVPCEIGEWVETCVRALQARSRENLTVIAG